MKEVSIGGNRFLLVDEIWKDIPGYDGYYMASTKGRIKSLSRTINRGGRKYFVHERVLSGSGKRYLRVSLIKDGINTSHNVHRLIAITFIENTHNKPQVNHINGVKHDNKIENLEWATSQENIQHGYDNGLLRPPRANLGRFGSLHNNPKKVIQKTREGHFVKIHGSMTEAAQSVGTYYQYISMACRGVCGLVKGYMWEYATKK